MFRLVLVLEDSPAPRQVEALPAEVPGLEEQRGASSARLPRMIGTKSQTPSPRRVRVLIDELLALGEIDPDAIPEDGRDVLIETLRARSQAHRRRANRISRMRASASRDDSSVSQRGRQTSGMDEQRGLDRSRLAPAPVPRRQARSATAPGVAPCDARL
jgi:hypothetical protein